MGLLWITWSCKDCDSNGRFVWEEGGTAVRRGVSVAIVCESVVGWSCVLGSGDRWVDALQVAVVSGGSEGCFDARVAQW